MGYKRRRSQQYALKRKAKPSPVKRKAVKKTTKREAAGPQVVQAGRAEEPFQEALPAGRTTLHFKGGKLAVTANVRYETEKVDPLIKTVHVADGKVVKKRFIGPKKRVVWMDDEGEEHDKGDVRLMQQLDDGRLVPIKMTKTKDIKVEPVPAKVMEEFHPYSFLEIWGEDEGDEEALRELAFELKMKGQAGAVKKFSHRYGKVYVGFIRPVIARTASPSCWR